MRKMYGSLVNRLMENQEEIPPIEVGMKVTEYLYTDRYVYEVTKVVNQKKVFIRKMDAKNLDGVYGSDNWELVSNPNRAEHEIVYRYNNWYMKIDEWGQTTYNKMNKLRFGCADYYYDWEM